MDDLEPCQSLKVRVILETLQQGPDSALAGMISISHSVSQSVGQSIIYQVSW